MLTSTCQKDIHTCIVVSEYLVEYIGLGHFKNGHLIDFPQTGSFDIIIYIIITHITLYM